jgi:hypothetical protein
MIGSSTTSSQHLVVQGAPHVIRGATEIRIVDAHGVIPTC